MFHVIELFIHQGRRRGRDRGIKRVEGEERETEGGPERERERGKRERSSKRKDRSMCLFTSVKSVYVHIITDYVNTNSSYVHIITNYVNRNSSYVYIITNYVHINANYLSHIICTCVS